MKTFGKRLKAAREKGGYRSAERFAHALALDPHAYRKYERGDAEPNFETIVRIKELLGISADYLLPSANDIAKDGSGHPAAA